MSDVRTEHAPANDANARNAQGSFIWYEFDDH